MPLTLSQIFPKAGAHKEHMKAAVPFTKLLKGKQDILNRIMLHDVFFWSSFMAMLWSLWNWFPAMFVVLELLLVTYCREFLIWRELSPLSESWPFCCFATLELWGGGKCQKNTQKE